MPFSNFKLLFCHFNEGIEDHYLSVEDVGFPTKLRSLSLMGQLFPGCKVLMGFLNE